uniref:Transposase n=1 Tax=Ralstonia solanacearum TaxID=305 RepID=A0A0S4VAB6_RALSL|nr:protein of unknown function [Ralstonia solanacearum]CUV22513.1 protein of unknown function [Ralstonia solanacearum]CUV31604.1 protein of unknown function [Ralstonia solanacearum]CUV32563.1 protein of unknown function [Ralstonia solanacearum]CUV41245.1 protein of unknown function [Ralstonia solanacearum]
MANWASPAAGKVPGRMPPSGRDRAVLTGILFVLQSGIPWEMLPQEMGCGSGHELLAQTARPAGSGRDPMGRRAHHRLAAQLQAPACSLRTPRHHPRGVRGCFHRLESASAARPRG